MAEVTYYVALPFVASDEGVAVGKPTECFNPMAAVMRAAFSRTGDSGTGDFRDAKVIRKFGAVPDDLSALS